MKNKFFKLGLIYLVLALGMSLFVACTLQPQEAKTSSIQITDQLGRVVTLDRVPQRIISLAPSNTEILFALGLGDKVVAVTNLCDYPPEAKEKPSIGGFNTTNIEEVVALSPDLILATSIHEKTIIPQLEQKGLTVLALNSKTLDKVLEAITMVGEITGKEEEASRLVTRMQNRIKAVTDKTNNLPEGERPRVFYLTWHDPLKTSGSGSLLHELIQKAGGRNIFAEVVGTKSVDLELLIARDPQVMIAGIGMGSGEDKTFQYLKTESRLQNTEAGKNGRIYKIDMDLTGRGGLRIVDGLEQFAKCIHPEIFGPPEN
ncbi:ABC transporter substrate-binding protein [Chloroflexota bacterium]